MTSAAYAAAVFLLLGPLNPGFLRFGFGQLDLGRRFEVNMIDGDDSAFEHGRLVAT